MKTRWSPLILLILLSTACSRTEAGPHAPGSAKNENASVSEEAIPAESSKQESHGEEHHGPIGHRFEKAEQWVSVFEDPERDAWQKPEQVIELMAIRPGHRVADIGAGTGYFLTHLSRAVGAEGQVLAVDIEPDMVRFIHDRAKREGWKNVEAQQARPDDPDLAHESMDRLLIVNTWHHIPNRALYATKLWRALRRDGAVFVVDYTMESLRGPPKSHRLPSDQVIQELRQGGFETKVLEVPLPYQYVVKGVKGKKR